MASRPFEAGLRTAYIFNCQQRVCKAQAGYYDHETFWPHGVTGARKKARSDGWGARSGKWYCPAHKKRETGGNLPS
jgi:hypothetical protein